MRLLASIPDASGLSSEAESPVLAAACATPFTLPDATPPRTIRVSPRPAFPWTSIAALVLLAGAAWSLAGWREARRLDRQQIEELLARQPVTTTSGEAVLR